MGSKNLRRTTASLSAKLYFIIMKKYLRLTLCVIAFISCLLVLVYHHKYSNLNLVLQMMNAFGKHSGESNCAKKLQELSKSSKLDWNTFETTLGLPLWTEIVHGMYVYSAYFLKSEVWVLSFIDNVPSIDVENLKCQLLYSNKSSSFTNVKVQLFQKNKASLFVILSCKMPGNDQNIPYGIRFQQYDVLSTTVLPIISRKSYISNFSMCVEPIPADFSDTSRIIEYLIYHHHIGVSHFIFYDQGLSPTIKQLLLEIVPKTHIFITLLPWNVPITLQSASKSSSEFFIDCIFRTASRNYSSFVLRGNINSFIVMKEAHNLKMLMSDGKFLSDPPRFYEEKFCLQYPDDIIARNLRIPFVTLLKNKMLQNDNGAYPVIYNMASVKDFLDSSDFKVWLFKGLPQKSMILPKHNAVLHTYEYCNKTVEVLEKNGGQDKFMWKYKNLLFRSRIFQLAKQQKLIILD